MENSTIAILCALALVGVCLNSWIRNKRDKRKEDLLNLRRRLGELLPKAREVLQQAKDGPKKQRASRELNVVEMEIRQAPPDNIFGKFTFKQLLRFEGILLSVIGAGTKGQNFNNTSSFVPTSARAEQKIQAAARANSRSKVAAQAAALLEQRSAQGIGPRKKA